jgi:hypothetical protein
MNWSMAPQITSGATSIPLPAGGLVEYPMSWLASSEFFCNR